MIKKVFLIELNEGLWNAGKFTRYACVEPLGIEYLGALAKERGCEVKIIQQKTMPHSKIVKEIESFNPDVVGISAMTYSLKQACELSSEIKNKNNKIITILGGYGPSMQPSVVKDEAVDFVVLAEGEYTFLELLDTLETAPNDISKIAGIKGIAFGDDQLILTQPRERIGNLDRLPYPLREKSLLEECKIYGITYPPVSEQKNVAQISYARGCPFTCNFCCTPVVLGRTVKYRSAEKVVEEMEYLQKTYETNLFLFSDPTFNLIDEKVYRLCQEIKNKRLEFNWIPLCNVRNVKKDTFEIMKEAGCSKVYFGVESTSEFTWRKINKKQRLQDINKAFELCNSLGLITKAFLMLGYPWESQSDIDETITWLTEMPVDEIRISFLTPFPGTPIYKEFKEKGLLMTEDYTRYTTTNPIVEVDNFSKEGLVAIQERVAREFYLSRKYETRKKEKIKRFPFLKNSYEEFFEFLYSKSVL